jgi:hypothetical protein
MTTPRQPREARSSTAHTRLRHERSPGTRPITLIRRRVSPKGPLDQVGVADPGPVLTREAQERGELGQAIQQTGDRCWVALAVAVSERFGAAARLIDRKLARVGGDVVEDLPERGLDLVLGVGGDPGEEIPGAVHQTPLSQVFEKTTSTAPMSPGAPSVITSSGARRPRATSSPRKPAQGSWPWWAPGASPGSTGLP